MIRRRCGPTMASPTGGSVVLRLRRRRAAVFGASESRALPRHTGLHAICRRCWRRGSTLRPPQCLGRVVRGDALSAAHSRCARAGGHAPRLGERRGGGPAAGVPVGPGGRRRAGGPAGSVVFAVRATAAPVPRGSVEGHEVSATVFRSQLC